MWHLPHYPASAAGGGAAAAAAHHQQDHSHNNSHSRDHHDGSGGHYNDDDDDDYWHGSIHDLQHAPDLDDSGTHRHGAGFRPRPRRPSEAGAASSSLGSSGGGGGAGRQRQGSLTHGFLFSSASTSSSRSLSQRNLGATGSLFVSSSLPPARRTRHMSMDQSQPASASASSAGLGSLYHVRGGSAAAAAGGGAAEGSMVVARGADLLLSGSAEGGASRRRIFSADHVRFLLPSTSSSSSRQLSPTGSSRQLSPTNIEALPPPPLPLPRPLPPSHPGSSASEGRDDSRRKEDPLASADADVERGGLSPSETSATPTATLAGTQVAFDLSNPEPLSSRISSLPVPEETQSQEEDEAKTDDDDDDDDDDDQWGEAMPRSVLSSYEDGENDRVADDWHGYSYQEHDPDTMGGSGGGGGAGARRRESDASIFRDRSPPSPPHPGDTEREDDEENEYGGLGGPVEHRRRVMSGSSVPSSLSSRGPLEVAGGNNSYSSASLGGGSATGPRAAGRHPQRKSISEFDDSGYNYDDEDDFGNDQSVAGTTTDDLSHPYSPESYGPEQRHGSWLCCLPWMGRWLSPDDSQLHRPSGPPLSASARHGEPPARRCPTMNQLAVLVVRYAPCFCFWGFKIQTDRLVLGRLNVLLAFFALYQMGAAMFLLIVLLNPRLVDRFIPEQTMNVTGTPTVEATKIDPAIWNMNGNIFVAGVVAFLIFTTAVLTWRVVRFVNLIGAIRFLWVLSWALPFEAFCMVCLLDYHSVTNVWVTHWWTAYQMAWFRRRYCAPGTFNTLCTVPYIYNATTGDLWCELNYNSTGCIAIRDEAQQQTNAFLRIFYTFSAIWSLVYIFLIFLTMDTLEHIISKPLVQKSIQSNLPGWLSLPMVFSILIGCVLLVAGRTPAGIQYLGSQYSWISQGYFTVGCLFFLAILCGWFISWSSIERTIDKKRKLVAVHLLIASMIAAALLLIAVFTTTIMFSVNLVQNPISDSMRGTIACTLGSTGGCSMCQLEANRCPEWSVNDVATIYKTQALAIATGSAIFFIYAVRTARFGFTMRQHLLSYQIEYV